MDKRNVCAALAHRLGLLRILEAGPKHNALLVLNYHRIGDQAATPFDEGVFSATASEFEAQVRLVQKRNGLVTLNEALNLLQNDKPFRGVPVLLTFDDGYRDNYELAFPILRSLGAQATFFLVSSFIGTDAIPWWDKIAWLVRQSPRNKLQLGFPTPFECNLPPGRRFVEIRSVLKHFKHSPAADAERYLSELEDACRSAKPPSTDAPLFMTWDEARAMLKGGMAIGSHTRTHRVLSQLSDEEQAQEVAQSDATLCQELGTKIETFAYPVGGRTEVTRAVRAALQERGYRAAFSYYGGVNSPGSIEPFDTRRLSVDAPTPFARFRMRVALAALTNGYWF